MKKFKMTTEHFVNMRIGGILSPDLEVPGMSSPCSAWTSSFLLEALRNIDPVNWFTIFPGGW